jgi:hypothetical protein
MDGWGSFQKVARSELDNGRVQSFFLSLISLILWFVDCASMGVSIFASMTHQCSYLLVYYYPCVSQFLTTQKEGENCMSLIS